jgi:hypothetical protein
MAGQYSNFKVTDQLGCRFFKICRKFPHGFPNGLVKLPFFNFRNAWTNAFQNTISESTTSCFFHGTSFLANRKLGYILLVGGFNHLEKYEFVNGKDDIPYMKWKIKAMFETTNQLAIVLHQPRKTQRIFSNVQTCPDDLGRVQGSTKHFQGVFVFKLLALDFLEKRQGSLPRGGATTFIDVY